MKAMILKKPMAIENNPLVIEEIEKPQLGPKDILIKNSVCGVCHTDLHIIEGDIEIHKLPIIPGHQIIGYVNEVGSEVSRFKKNERVGVAWLQSVCGNCAFCKSNYENLCESAKFTGYDKDGGYTEFTLASEDFIYHIDYPFDDAHTAPLLCAGIIGYRALKFSSTSFTGNGFKPFPTILGIYGFGASAHITIQIARYIGCDVFVFTRSDKHKNLARELGAIWTGNAEDTPPKQMDCSIIFAPSGKLVPEALRVLKKGGIVTLAGIHMTPIPEMNYNLIYGERTIKSVTNNTRQDAEELLTLASKIPIKTEVEVFPLNEANNVLKLLKDSKIRGSAILHIP